MQQVRKLGAVLMAGERVGGVEQQVRDLLAEVYTPEGVETWLNARNQNLGRGKPLMLLRCSICAACPAKVLAEAERLAGAS